MAERAIIVQQSATQRWSCCAAIATWWLSMARNLHYVNTTTGGGPRSCAEPHM